MGQLVYARSGLRITFDDRTLRHLQIVMEQKLRRGEGFFLSWDEGASTGFGHGSIWISPAIMLAFRYQSNNAIDIDRAWLAQLSSSATTPAGLVVHRPAALVERPAPAALLGSSPGTRRKAAR